MKEHVQTSRWLIPTASQGGSKRCGCRYPDMCRSLHTQTSGHIHVTKALWTSWHTLSCICMIQVNIWLICEETPTSDAEPVLWPVICRRAVNRLQWETAGTRYEGVLILLTSVSWWCRTNLEDCIPPIMRNTWVIGTFHLLPLVEEMDDLGKE